MAAPIVCVPCLQERHDACMEHSEEWADRRRLVAEQVAKGDIYAGGQFCICYKCSGTDSPWARSVWDRDMETLKNRTD